MIELFTHICKKLNEAKIDYMLSGSLALNLYTVPRMTRDIDVVIELKQSDINLFISNFKDRFYFNENTIREETNKKGMFNIIDTDTGYKVDFIVRKDSPYRKTEFERKKQVEMMGVDTWVVSIEDLILSKLIWIQQLQSDKQMEDITNLLDNDHIDFPYLRHWIEKLKLQTFELPL